MLALIFYRFSPAFLSRSTLIVERLSVQAILLRRQFYLGVVEYFLRLLFV